MGDPLKHVTRVVSLWDFLVSTKAVDIDAAVRWPLMCFVCKQPVHDFPVWLAEAQDGIETRRVSLCTKDSCSLEVRVRTGLTNG